MYIDNIISDIFQKGIKKQNYNLKTDNKIWNSIFLATKPFGTFNKEFIRELVCRANRKGYYPLRYVVVNNQEYNSKQIVRQQYKHLFEIAMGGVRNFVENEYIKLKSIYSQVLEDVCKTKIIPTYTLMNEYALKREDIEALWRKGYDKRYYLTNDYRGINKIGMYKYLLLTSDSRINHAEPFFLLNGLVIQLENDVKKYSENVVGFVLVGECGQCATWKEMREEFLGDNVNPIKCNAGSIRYDAFFGNMHVTCTSELPKNVVHMSCSVLESLAEEMLWFDQPIEETIIGKALLGQNFCRDEINELLQDPFIELNGDSTTLFHIIAKQNMEEVLEFLKNMAHSPKLENKWQNINKLS